MLYVTWEPGILFTLFEGGNEHRYVRLMNFSDLACVMASYRKHAKLGHHAQHWVGDGVIIRPCVFAHVL